MKRTHSDLESPKKWKFGNNFVIELDKYWPCGLINNDAEDQKENTDLLFIYQFDGKIHCRYCESEVSKPVELEAKMRYVSVRKSLEVPFSEHPDAFREFLEGYDAKAQKTITYSQILRSKCCQRDFSAFFTVPEKILRFSRLFRYFCQANRILVYLKMDPASVALIPWELDESFAQTLKESYLNAFWSVKRSQKLSDTLDIPMAEVPSDFKLILRDYQLRSIKWMQLVESADDLDENTIYNDSSAWNNKKATPLKIKLGHSPFYAGFNEDEVFSLTPEIETEVDLLKIRSGILADDTGSGKTITTIGLIHSSPFTAEKERDRANRFKDLDSFHQSRATCVICPENIQLQWIEEARRCNPEFLIVSYASERDEERVTLDDLCKSDLIVTSYNFSIKRKETLQRIHFHRIILDEFHELTPTSNAINSILKRLRCDHIWGLTGTPNFNCLPAFLRYFNLSSALENEISGNIFAYNEFMRKFVKRNEPDLALPLILKETVWVQLSSSELVLHEWKSERASRRTRMMMCSHYQLAEKSKGNTFVTMEQVKNLMIKSKVDEIETAEKQISEIVEEMIEKKGPENVNSLINLEHQLTALEKHLEDSRRKLNYSQSVFRVINDPEGYECRICYEMIEKESLSMLPCSHVFCYECVAAAIRRNCECPLCRQSLRDGRKGIFRIVPESKDKSNLPGILREVDISRYSSKMLALCKYLIELIESDGDCKIILFLQYKNLGDFISTTFRDELKLNHVRVAGDIEQRQSAIKRFTEDSSVKLIMLSSEDSVSGINLTKATHVILLHPFWTDQGESVDQAYEKQGISRAYRYGLSHPLKVVRFAVKDSVEESITLKREKMKL